MRKEELKQELVRRGEKPGKDKKADLEEQLEKVKKERTERTGDIRAMLLEFKTARERFTTAEADRKKIKGLRGILGIETEAKEKETGKSRGEIKDEIEKEYEEAKKDYETKREQYIFEKVSRKLNEQSRLSDERAKAYQREKGWGATFDRWYKGLSKKNVASVFGQERMKKLQSKKDDDPFTKIGKASARFLARTLSMRTGLTVAMLGMGFVFALPGIGFSTGIIATVGARRVLAGIGGGFGSYSVMKMISEKKEQKKGMRKKLTLEKLEKASLKDIIKNPKLIKERRKRKKLTLEKLENAPLQDIIKNPEVIKELQNMSSEEIAQRMEYFEVHAELNGEKVRDDKTYNVLKYEFNQRVKAGKIEKTIDELLKQSEKGLKTARAKEVKKEWKRKGIAVGVGLAFANLGKIIGGVKELFAGGAEAGEAGAQAAMGAEAGEAGAEVGESDVEAAISAEHIEYQGGKSIWQEIENQMHDRSAFKNWYESADEAERTHAIDYIKDKIVKTPGDYGLPKGIDPDLLPKDQLENIDWDKAFSEATSAQELDNVMPELTQEAKDSIIQNNELLRDYALQSGEAIDSSTVDELLVDIKDAGGVDQYMQGLEAEQAAGAAETTEAAEATEIAEAEKTAETAGAAEAAEAPVEASEEYWKNLTDEMNTALEDPLAQGNQDKIKDLISKAIQKEQEWGLDKKQTRFFLRVLEGNDGVIGKDFAGLVAEGNTFNKDTLDLAIEHFNESLGSGKFPDSDMWTPRYIYNGATGETQLANIRNTGSHLFPKYEIDYNGWGENNITIKGLDAKRELLRIWDREAATLFEASPAPDEAGIEEPTQATPEQVEKVAEEGAEKVTEEAKEVSAVEQGEPVPAQEAVEEPVEPSLEAPAEVEAPEKLQAFQQELIKHHPEFAKAGEGIDRFVLNEQGEVIVQGGKEGTTFILDDKNNLISYKGDHAHMILEPEEAWRHITHAEVAKMEMPSVEPSPEPEASTIEEPVSVEEPVPPEEPAAVEKSLAEEKSASTDVPAEEMVEAEGPGFEISEKYNNPDDISKLKELTAKIQDNIND